MAGQSDTSHPQPPGVSSADCGGDSTAGGDESGLMALTISEGEIARMLILQC